MLISTKGGDSGKTSLIYGARVRKDDLQVEAFGTVDELNSALGLARVNCSDGYVSSVIREVQNHTLVIGSELATPEGRKPKKVVTDEMVGFLEKNIEKIESSGNIKYDWAIPGDTVVSAYLDLARAVARRAERRAVTLFHNYKIGSDTILRYLNRLSDFLWMAARHLESEQLK